MGIGIAIVAAMIVFYVGVYVYMTRKKKQLNNLDLKSEMVNAEKYKADFLAKTDMNIVRDQMDGKPIDALNYGSIEKTTKGVLKNMGKDILRTAATLSTVRYTTVATTKYIILSGADLHLLDTNADGDIDSHLIFDASRLRSSSIEEIPLSGQNAARAKSMGAKVKGYKLSLTTGEEPIKLIIFSALTTNSDVDAGKSLINNLNTQNVLVKNIIANDFLKKLGEQYSNLRVAIPAHN